MKLVNPLSLETELLHIYFPVSYVGYTEVKQKKKKEYQTDIQTKR